MPLVTNTRSLIQTLAAGNGTSCLHNMLTSELSKVLWSKLRRCIRRCSWPAWLCEMTTMQMSLGFSGSRPFFAVPPGALLRCLKWQLDSKSCCCILFALEWSETVWDISLSSCESEDGYEKKKCLQTMRCFDLSSSSWWGNYLNPYGNIYFAFPHIAGFHGSPSIFHMFIE